MSDDGIWRDPYVQANLDNSMGKGLCFRSKEQDNL